MVELLETFSLSEIVFVMIALFGGFKGFMSAWDWLKEYFSKDYVENINSKQELNHLKTNIEENAFSISDFEKQQERMLELMETMKSEIAHLKESDRDFLKNDLVKDYHYFKRLGWIDPMSYECVLRKFEHYRTEGGNSYICEIVEEMKKMPREKVDVGHYQEEVHHSSNRKKARVSAKR